MSIPFIITDNSITVVVHGKPFTTSASNVNYNIIKQRLSDGDYEGIEKLFDTGEAVGSFTQGNIVVKDNAVFYKGQIVNNHLVDRILSFMREGLPYKPLVNFLDNLMANPSYRAVQELYGFLEASNLPITDDGHFLAYRKVTDDYKDFYSQKFDNSIGSTVEMPRNLVNEDKDQTCSSGLHFCSQRYLSQYAGGRGRVVIVKINPADVVAIPSDYNNAKGRCCKYVVLSDCAGYEEGEKFDSLYRTNPDEETENSCDSEGHCDSGDCCESDNSCECDCKYCDCEDHDDSHQVDENCTESYELGYGIGERDAHQNQIRDPHSAWQNEKSCQLVESTFLKGYNEGYTEYLEYIRLSETSAPKARVGRKHTQETRQKLSRIAKAAKRDSKGNFSK